MFLLTLVIEDAKDAAAQLHLPAGKPRLSLPQSLGPFFAWHWEPMATAGKTQPCLADYRGAPETQVSENPSPPPLQRRNPEKALATPPPPPALTKVLSRGQIEHLWRFGANPWLSQQFDFTEALTVWGCCWHLCGGQGSSAKSYIVPNCSLSFREESCYSKSY